MQGAQEISLPSQHGGHNLEVEVRVDGKRLGRASVPLNASKVEVPFDLGGLKPQKGAFDVECLATLSPTPNPNANPSLGAVS